MKRPLVVFGRVPASMRTSGRLSMTAGNRVRRPRNPHHVDVSDDGYLVDAADQQSLTRERVLFVSFDSTTTLPRSATATSVPTRQADHVRDADWLGARPGNANVPISVTLTTNGPAGALPAFVTVKPVSPSAETTRSGSGRATVHECVAAVPVLPAASVAWTANVCAPGASAEYARGLVQLANAPPSSEQANVEPDSEDVNSNVASLPDAATA